jgi:hypothetical protein
MMAGIALGLLLLPSPIFLCRRCLVFLPFPFLLLCMVKKYMKRACGTRPPLVQKHRTRPSFLSPCAPPLTPPSPPFFTSSSSPSSLIQKISGVLSSSSSSLLFLLLLDHFSSGGCVCIGWTGSGPPYPTGSATPSASHNCNLGVSASPPPPLIAFAWACGNFVSKMQLDMRALDPFFHVCVHQRPTPPFHPSPLQFGYRQPI